MRKNSYKYKQDNRNFSDWYMGRNKQLRKSSRRSNKKTKRQQGKKEVKKNWWFNPGGSTNMNPRKRKLKEINYQRSNTRKFPRTEEFHILDRKVPEQYMQKENHNWLCHKEYSKPQEQRS